MDRIAQLIGKLKEQFEQNADPSQLLMTTQMIESELRQLSSTPGKALGSSKVSVMMPSARQSRSFDEVITAPAKQEIAEPVVKNGAQHQPKKEESNGWEFNPMTEIPTLSHQQSVRELNEMMATDNFSLNDKLKEQVVEVGHILTDAPIRDLKRAIGINDRFVFINELFRGDEVMYERSLKTINSFRIFPEAEYWIERELKVKLGWDDMKDTTRHFYQLVKRRFS